MSTATRGLASQSAERRREIARMGGSKGGHRWTREEAAKAGSVGGKISKRPATSYNRRVPEGEQLV